MKFLAAGKIALSISLTLLGLLILTFFLGRSLPVDPVRTIVGEQADQATYDAVYRQLGMDKPLYVQFQRFGRQMLMGDFGNSINTGHRVSDDIRRVFPATVELVILAAFLGSFLGIPLGVLAAVHQARFWDNFVRVLGLIGFSAPGFWLGLIGLLLFYSKLGWLGGPERISLSYLDAVPALTGMTTIDALLAQDYAVFLDAVRHIILPAGILSLGLLAYLSRMTRSFMLEQLRQEYVITARAKGLSARRVIWIHAFRNTRVQLLTILVISFAHLLEGSVLVESVFSWPGFGQYLTQGLLTGDMNAVLACTLLVGVIFVTANLSVEYLYRHLDPRTLVQA